MKKRFCLLPFLSFLIASCSKGENTYYVESNPFQLSRNGDLFLSDFDNSGYSDLGVAENASTTISRSEMGESFNILRVSDTCHTCVEFEKTFVSFIKETFLDVIIYSSENINVTANISSLESHFGEDKIVQSVDRPFLKNTPTWYVGNEKEGIKILNWGYSNKKDLTSNFLKQSSLTNLYKFSSVEALQKGLEEKDSLIYFLDSKNEKSLSFYKDFLYEKAIKSEKRTYIFVTERASSEAKERAYEYFGDYSVMLNDKKESLDNQASLKSIVSSYYE